MAWTNAAKDSPESWLNTDKERIIYERGRILTPDGDQVLVGPLESLILIWQEENLSGGWSNTPKGGGNSWNNLSKDI